MAGILDQLFGMQPQNQSTGGLIQSILSQRFQPSMEDAANATLQTATTGGRFVSPYEAMSQRIAPALGVAGTVGQLDMTQVALQKMLDDQTRTDLLVKEFLGKNPAGAGTGLPVGFPAQTNSMPDQTGGNPPIGFNMPRGAASPQVQSNDMQGLYPESFTGGGMASQQGGELPLTESPLQGRQPVNTGFGTPIAAPEGPVLMRDASGNVSAGQLPGAPPKMENGMAVTTDARTGQPMQQVPVNPVAKAKFETQLQEMKNLYEQLEQAGGTVEQGGSMVNNAWNTVAGSNFSFPIPGTGERADVGGGQTLSRVAGTQAQTIRDHINNLSKQMMLPYMQAVGATPGMERAQGSQMMMLQALGSNPTQTRQTVEGTLADLSRQAGTGDLYNQLNPQQNNLPQGGQTDNADTKTINGVIYTKINGVWHQ